MTTTNSAPRPIEITPGVRPETEGTSLTAKGHLLAAYGIRFFNGFVQKIGGFDSVTFDNGNTISGKARSIFSAILNGFVLTLIGTHTRLYSIYGSTLLNITPLKTSSTAAANSLATLYGTLANNPITTVNGSKVLTIADTSASRLRVGDNVTLSGATATNGVPIGNINAAQVVRSIGTNSYTIIVATAATSSGTGGGAAVVRATGLIQLTKATHGLGDGERIKVSGAANTGGILAAAINLEWIIRVTGVNTYDFMTASTATSSVSAAGGASTVYFPQIDAGAASETAGQGYGMGKYGAGLYGAALLSLTALNIARIWYFTERFADVVMMTAGNQTGLYEWNGLTAAAPVLVTNAPTAINYAFVSNNILVTLGAQGVENRIKTSDQGDRTNWTSSATNQVFTDDIEGAGRFLSHLRVKGVNLLFTSNQTRTFRYIGGTFVWEVKDLDLRVGIIGPMARCEAGGIGFWMGQDNFYMWRGGVVEIIPANTQAQSTILKYVFDNLNRSQTSKFFAEYNTKYNEIEFHYCSMDSDEPNRIARVNLNDFSWCPDECDRTAAEYPNVSLQYPRKISSAGVLYYHEKGVDADGAALPFSYTLPDRANGKFLATMVSVVPDSVQVGNITLSVEGRKYPQSSIRPTKTYTIEPDEEIVATLQAARIWQYTISGSAVGQSFTMGLWHEETKDGAGK